MNGSIAILLLQNRWWHHDGGMMGWHWAWWLFWAVVAVVLIWVVTRAVSSGRKGPVAGPSGSATEETPEDTLRRKYAAGDLSKEEFQERLEILRGSR